MTRQSQPVPAADPALSGRKVLLAVGGGIAAYKAVEILRALQKGGASVQVLMTKSAQQFVAPLTFQTLSGQPVATDLFSLTEESLIGHIRLARDSDVILVAPATANRLAKAAHGIADDLLATVLVATTRPVVMAPAMNVEMWNHPATQANKNILMDRGVVIVEPGAGDLACGEVGQGRLAEIEDIVEAVAAALTPKDLEGKRVLVTAGPTREPVDPVRYLSNRSSGKMGYAMAQAAARRGATVTLVSGPTALAVPAGIAKTVQVKTAADMFDAVKAALPAADVVVKTAAVADYRPKAPSDKKLKRREKSESSIELEPTVDILRTLGKNKGGRYLVGFAAETHDLKKYAQGKLAEKNLDLIVANDVSRSDAGFETDTNAVTLFFRDGKPVELPLGSKLSVATSVWNWITEDLKGLPPQSRPGKSPGKAKGGAGKKPRTRS